MELNDYYAKRERKIWAAMYIVLLIIWATFIMRKVGFDRYLTHFPIPLTMIFGGFVSGFAPVGGGAISFPVFSKVLEMAPAEARDFGFAIQSFGMTFASISILLRKIKIEKKVVLFSSLGGFVGIIFSNIFIVPFISPSMMKLLFTLMTTSFGVALFINNFVLKRRYKYREVISNFSKNDMIILFIVGVVGGSFSAILGTGIDIFTFSIITILYKLDEKVINPTSDIIMAINSIIGLTCRFIFAGSLAGEAMLNFPLAIPIVTIVAPLGAIVVSKLSRVTVVKFIILGILVEIITTLTSTEITLNVIIISTITFVFSYLFYYGLTKYSDRKIN